MTSRMHAPGEPLIRLAEVTRTFPSRPAARRGSEPVRALQDVDLEIPRGEVWGVVGPNGAGKSTLFAVILGFLHATSGWARVDGRLPRRYLREAGAGYLPDRFTLPDSWTVIGALVGLARLEGLRAGEAGARVDALIQRLGLADSARRAIGDLSRGALQRVGIAQALLGERDLVVLDEPTQGLDPLWRVRLRELLADLKGEGRTVLLASHDLGEVERVADRVVLLRNGRVMELRTPPEDESLDVRLLLAEPFDEVSDAFPGARPEGGTGPASLAWRVRAASPRELTDRLAALLASGAVLLSVEPRREQLEERVRRALEGGPA